MRAVFIAPVFLLNAALLAGQQPAASQEQANDLGFTYTLPSDWQVLSASPTLSGVKAQAQQSASSD
jgi:hypothetical protein